MVKLSLHGLDLDEINNTLDQKVLSKSLRRWLQLYAQTQEVVRDPALYADCGHPLAISQEGAKFILAALEADPTLYMENTHPYLSHESHHSFPLYH